jgi:hypothetical protein
MTMRGSIHQPSAELSCSHSVDAGLELGNVPDESRNLIEKARCADGSQDSYGPQWFSGLRPVPIPGMLPEKISERALSDALLAPTPERPGTRVTVWTDDMGNTFPVSFISDVAGWPVGLWVTRQGYPQVRRLGAGAF